MVPPVVFGMCETFLVASTPKAFGFDAKLLNSEVVSEILNGLDTPMEFPKGLADAPGL